MKKYILVILSIIIVVSSISITCFAVGKPSVAPNGNGNNTIVISDDPEVNKTTTSTETTKKTTIATDPVTTNMYQYAEAIKTTTPETTNNKNQQGHTETSTKHKKIYMNATFISEVPEEIKKDIIISVFNEDTKDAFDITLSANNSFFAMEELPIGNYVYTKVTIPDNENNRFVPIYRPFYVGQAMNIIVNFEVIDKEATETESSTEIVINTGTTTLTEESTEAAIVVETPQKNSFPKIIFPIAIIVLVIAIYIFKKHNKKNNDETDETSDNNNTNFINRF
jgi:hypothetical protein